jgi:beta-phosphoglucomutase-like phosphatase (HAD superfamily)
MAIEAVIFDCDGTLVDSVPVAAEVLVEYLADLGVRLSVADKETDSEARRAQGAAARPVCPDVPR